MYHKTKVFLLSLFLLRILGAGVQAREEEEQAITQEEAIRELLMLFMRPAGLGGDPKKQSKQFHDKVWGAVNWVTGEVAADMVDPRTGAVGSNRSDVPGALDIRQQEVTGLALLRAGEQKRDPKLTLLGAKAIHFAFQKMQNEDGSFMYSKPGGKSLKGTAYFTVAACQAIEILSRSRERSNYRDILKKWEASTRLAALWLCSAAKVPGISKKIPYADQFAAAAAALVHYQSICPSQEKELIFTALGQWLRHLAGPDMQSERGGFRAGKGTDTVLQAYVLVLLTDAYAHNQEERFDEPILALLQKASHWQKHFIDDDGKPKLMANSMKRDTKQLELMDLAMLIMSLKMWAIVGNDEEADMKSRKIFMYTISHLNDFSSDWAGEFADGAMSNVQDMVGGR